MVDLDQGLSGYCIALNNVCNYLENYTTNGANLLDIKCLFNPPVQHLASYACSRRHAVCVIKVEW
jgi:hypothetical protein